MDDFSFVIAEDLNLNVVRILDKFFNIDAGIAERFFGFGTGGMKTFD